MTKNVWVLMLAQAFAMCAAPLVVFAGGLIGQQLAINNSFATLPVAAMVIGTALAVYPAAVLASGARIVTNTREIDADDFFDGMFATALEEGEIVTAVIFPACAACAYAKYPNPASRYAMAGVFLARTGAGIRAAVTGAGASGVFRHEGLEAALAESLTPQAAAGVATDPGTLISDIHGSAEYRANLIAVMAKRAAAKLAS